MDGATAFRLLAKAAVSVAGFVVRHLLFVAFATLLGMLLWTVAYVVLLGVAILLNEGLGGPLAWPVGMIAVALGCVVIGLGVFAPASAIGAVFCALFRWPRMAAIPVVWLAALILGYAATWVFTAFATTHSMPGVGTVAKNVALYLSVPLGIYWWLTEGPGALFDAFRCWLRRRYGAKRIAADVQKLT